MKATYDPNAKTKFTTSHRRETPCWFTSCSVISLASKPSGDYREINEPITLRLYSTQKATYACLWVNSSPIHTQGSHCTTGGGFHRASDAAHYAIRNAGFSLDVAIDGLGDGAIKTALLAIAKCIGVNRPAIVSSHQ